MNLTRTPAPPAMSSRDLADLVSAVHEDPTLVVTGIQTAVQRSEDDANSCMMGGWTS